MKTNLKVVNFFKCIRFYSLVVFDVFIEENPKFDYVIIVSIDITTQLFGIFLLNTAKKPRNYVNNANKCIFQRPKTSKTFLTKTLKKQFGLFSKITSKQQSNRNE